MVILQLVEQSRKDPTPLVPCSLRNQNSLNCKGPFRRHLFQPQLDQVGHSPIQLECFQG